MSCTAIVTGGVAPYTYHWSERIYLYVTNKFYIRGPFISSRSGPFSYSCIEPYGNGGEAFSDSNVRVYVIDANGAQSTSAQSGWYSCI